MLRYLHLVSYDIGDDKCQAVVREQVKNLPLQDKSLLMNAGLPQMINKI